MLRYPGQDLDYQRLVKAGRGAGRAACASSIKLAILADCATQQLAILLKALLEEADVRAEIYEGAFDGIELESSASSSGLYRFEPDAVIIMNCAQALRAAYGQRTPEQPGFVAERLSRVVAVWDAIRRRSQATILQSTFALPVEAHFGNFELNVPTSLRSSVIALNAGLVEAARSRIGLLVHDVEALASWIGRRQFFDDRAWDLWKVPCALEHLPRIAKNMVDVLVASRGRVVKCVVADLDNTLWGGVVGDDGVEGLVLSAHGGGEGECYVRVQRFLKELQLRGVLLAVCSKNDEATALAPFLRHPDMVLRREDISVFVADWDDKASGIRRIRDTLNIGLDSIVFLDDNVFERNLVRELLPEVIVPELPEDPAKVVAFLTELNLFETVSVSDEDRGRSALYRREAQRRDSAARCASVEDYLGSLDMRAVIARFDRFHLPRVAQLMQRSNQFNLCTRRLTEAQCAALAQDDTFLPLYALLADRFGEHGLICVVVLERAREGLLIRDWLMSCRVLARGVEQYLMNHVVAHAAQLGLRQVIGEYVPTAKNAMVRDFFPQFGFQRVPETAHQWRLDVAAYRPCETFIRAAQSPPPVPGEEVA